MTEIVIMGSEASLIEVETALSKEFGEKNVATSLSIFENGKNLSVDGADHTKIIDALETIENITAETTHLKHLCDDIICVNITETAEPS